MIYLSLDGFNDELSTYVHWLEFIRLTRLKRNEYEKG